MLITVKCSERELRSHFWQLAQTLLRDPPQLPKMDSPTSVKDIFSNLQIYKFSS